MNGAPQAPAVVVTPFAPLRAVLCVLILEIICRTSATIQTHVGRALRGSDGGRS